VKLSREAQIARAVLIVLIAVVLGGLRIVGVKHEAFQAVAHLYVGFLFGVGAATYVEGNTDRGCLWLAIGLSVLELVCFLVFRFM
jgi:1,4-dihydroxy-2-naphthoate octaprenyltransferase